MPSVTVQKQPNELHYDSAAEHISSWMFSKDNCDRATTSCNQQSYVAYPAVAVVAICIQKKWPE